MCYNVGHGFIMCKLWVHHVFGMGNACVIDELVMCIKLVLKAIYQIIQAVKP
jgi:hypothetical protein